MTWTYESQAHAVIQIPALVQTVEYSFNVVFTAESNLKNVFLYTIEDFEGIVEAKLSTQTYYRFIMSYSFTPSCYLGNINNAQSVTINFKLSIPTGSEYLGEHFIPIKIGSGDNISPKYFDGTNPFWRNDSTDDPFFWISSSEEADEWIWIGGTS
jgi:hypothetical protein